MCAANVRSYENANGTAAARVILRPSFVGYVALTLNMSPGMSGPFRERLVLASLESMCAYRSKSYDSPSK